MPEECPQGVVDLFRACVAKEPGARPTATGVQAALEALLPETQKRRSQELPAADVLAAGAASTACGAQRHAPPPALPAVVADTSISVATTLPGTPQAGAGPAAGTVRSHALHIS